MKGCIVDATYETIEEKTVVRFFGRLENGQSFMTTHTQEPYFYVKKSDKKKITSLLAKFKVEESTFTTFDGEAVIKISGNTFPELGKLSSLIHKKEVDTYEADVKPLARFKIDNNLRTYIDIDGDYTSGERVDRVYLNPTLRASDFKPKLKMISLDIESDKADGDLYCIGLYGEKYQKNFMVTKQTLKNTVSCKDESDCLEKFKAELLKQDPDIIVGWNVIDFDFAYLKEKFKKHKIPFDIGRTNAQIRIRIEGNFFRSSSATIEGRQVLDALSLIRDPFIKEAPSIKFAEFDSYTLEDVAQTILKTGKLLKGKGRHKELQEMYKSDQQGVVDYNLMDCKLVYDIVEEIKIIDLALERVQLTGLPLDKLTSSIAAFDSLYLRAALQRGLVSPTTRYIEKEERITGGYVKTPQPGLYYNVLVLDFKSLYPSIIKTFNIDPASYITKKEKGAIEAPNGALFRNQAGILPAIIQELHLAREKAKKEKRELSSYAIKIIMNSFFGVLASPNCRYFSLEMANAITHFGQKIIKLTAEQIEAMGLSVIYSDTDSVFVETKAGEEKANALGRKIEESINSFYKHYVTDGYARESFLELQFEKQYLAMMFPRVRMKEGETTQQAAKKRYAGLKKKDGKEELEVVGLEAIRGDWTEAAQEFQKELLLRVFHKEMVEQFIRTYVQKLMDGKMDKHLVYTKSLRKGLDEYTKTTPPHVKAARKLDKLDSNVIQYYITTEGPEPLQKLTHKIDYEHYLDKQLIPIANQVLSLIGKSFEDVVKNSKQKTLF